MAVTVVKTSPAFRLLNFFKPDLAKKYENELYSIDIFNPEPLLKKCSILAAFATLLIAVLCAVLPFLFSLPFAELRLVAVATSPMAVLLYPSLYHAIFAIYVKTMRAEKRAEINKNFYSMLCMFAGFAKGKIPLSEAIHVLSVSKLRGIREEFAKLYFAMTLQGLDLRTATLKIALSTPHEKFAHFLRGLVNYVTEKMDYAGYIDNFLLIDNVNKKIELASYADKLRNIAGISVVLVALISTLSIISLASAEFGNIELVVYLGYPLVAASTAILMRVGNPLRLSSGEKGKEATYLFFACFTIAIVAVFLDLLYPKVLIPLLAVSISLAVFGIAYTFKPIRREKRITLELNDTLMKLYAASQTQRSILETLENIGETIGETLRPFISKAKIKPMQETLMEASEKLKHPFLASTLYVLSNVIHKTKNLTDVLVALIYEYSRFHELEKMRRSLATTSIVVIATCFFLVLASMWIVKFQLVPVFAKMASIGGDGSFSVERAIRIANHSVALMAGTIPLSVGAFTGDFRKAFPLFALFCSVAAVFLMF